jgi:PAS domain S-box-containing protein
VEQRTAELKEAESKYRDLVENANSIILELDTSGKISFLNRFAQDFFGFSEAETVGHHVVGTIIPPTDSEGNDLKVKIKNLTKNPEDHYAIESEGIRQDGRLVWISWTNKGLYDKKGRVRRILCIGMDRTEQRQAAAAGPRPSRRCDSDAFLSQPHRRSAAQAMGERPRRRPAPSRRTAATDSRRFG